MTDNLTTRPMLEALLEGQRQLGSQMAGLHAGLAAMSQKHDDLASKVDDLTTKVDGIAAKQDQLDARMTALTREVRDGFDEYNRKIDALDKRLLSFETWLSRIDDRLHDEIVARTR